MIKVIQMQDDVAWDNYVARHTMSNAYHISHWQKVISSAYGYKSYALSVVSNDHHPTTGQPNTEIKGLLPLVHMKNPLFGNRLVSMPFFDHGGLLADTPEYELKLLEEASALGKRLKVQHIELRHLNKITSLEDGQADLEINRRLFFHGWTMRGHKVRLLLSLPDSSESLMKGFKSKLRSQIRRPIKAGLTANIGGMELLDHFYDVFSINMRDLGSPVHAKNLLESVMRHFQENAKIAVVYKDNKPIAAALIVGCKDVVINPWASSLRSHSKESPNMLLYWTMLAYAADHGFRKFDFGRSTPDEGTYRFKTQWGAKPHPMYWYTFLLDAKNVSNVDEGRNQESKKKSVAIGIWKKLPVSVSRLIGPHIRKHIDL